MKLIDKNLNAWVYWEKNTLINIYEKNYKIESINESTNNRRSDNLMNIFP